MYLKTDVPSSDNAARVKDINVSPWKSGRFETVTPDILHNWRTYEKKGEEKQEVIIFDIVTDDSLPFSQSRI